VPNVFDHVPINSPGNEGPSSSELHVEKIDIKIVTSTNKKIRFNLFVFMVSKL
jgi:hypothetical protein